MATHLQEAAIVETIFTDKDRLHRGLHVVVDAALAGTLEQSERPVVGERGLTNRRSFIGGSDARTIMGDDEAALLRLWREKRGEVEPEDLSGNLIVQLGK